jgi:hypothetical protein
VGLGGCNFASLKEFQVLKSSSMFSTQHSRVLSRSFSQLQMGIIILVFKLCSTRRTKYSVSEINMAGSINLSHITSALISLISSMDFILRILLISTSSTIVWVDNNFSKSLRGSILNRESRMFEDLHSSLLIVMKCSNVLCIYVIFSSLHSTVSDI